MRDVDCFFVRSAIEIVRFYGHRKHYFFSSVYSRVISFYGDFQIDRFNCSIDGYVKLKFFFSAENNRDEENAKYQSNYPSDPKLFPLSSPRSLNGSRDILRHSMCHERLSLNY